MSAELWEGWCRSPENHDGRNVFWSRPSSDECAALGAQHSRESLCVVGMSPPSSVLADRLNEARKGLRTR